MRILHINIGYPPFLGGSQLHLQRIAQGLARSGHHVQVWASAAGEVEALWDRGKMTLPPGNEMDGPVSVRRFPVRHLPLPYQAYHGLRRLALELSRSPWANAGVLWRLARYTPWLPELERAFQEEGPEVDLVHAWNIPFESLLGPAWQFARRRGIPFVITPLVHLGEPGDDQVRRGYTMPHQLALLRQSDGVIALSQMEADYLVGEKVPPGRLHVVGGGVDASAIAQGDTARFRRTQGLPDGFVLFLGAHNPHKGAIHLFQAMIQLWEQGETANLVMIGQAMEPFQRFYDGMQPRWQARCHLLGQVGEEEKADALAACALLALPSRTESFGLVYLEAWAAGKPVVGAAAGAVPAVVEDGVDGLLVPFGDTVALAEAMSALLRDPERAAALGRSGQAKALARYTWESVIEGTMSVYRHVLGAL